MMGSINIIFFVFCVNSVNAQEISNKVISSAGNDFNQLNGNIGFTLGETVIDTYSSTENQLTQGFHQSYFIVSTVQPLKDEYPFLSIYPNPTSDLLNIEFKNPNSKGYIVKVYNTDGKELQTTICYNNKLVLSLSQFNITIYMIEIQDIENQDIIIYKVAKMK